MLRKLSWLLITYLADLSSENTYNRFYNKFKISKPALPKRPFISVWNIETGECDSQYGVHIDLNQFDIVNNNNQTRNGKVAVIFYANLLGKYPLL